MRFDLTFYLCAWVFLILLALLFCWFWQGGKRAPAVPKPAKRKRESKPFAGYTRKPECERCDQGMDSDPQALTAPPPRMSFTRGRRRQVDTTGHFCPSATCSYHGWVDFGNIRANGHPNGRRWRQLVCLSCHGYFLETVDTPFHGKQVDADKWVWAMTALAEGLGIRAVARVFETDPNTVLRWLVEVAEHVEAFSHYHLRDVYAEHIQMDELFALLSAVKEGEISEAQAIKRLSRSPYWVCVGPCVI
jgi:transposase-like protein